MNISAFTVVRRQVWDRLLEKAEMVPEVLEQPEMAGQVPEAWEMPLKEA